MRFKVLRVCQSKGFSVVPMEVVRFDLEKAAVLLAREGYEVGPSDVMLTASLGGGMDITLYINGRLMIQPLESKDAATMIAERFYGIIEVARE